MFLSQSNSLKGGMHSSAFLCNKMLSNEFDKEDIKYIQNGLFSIITDVKHCKASKNSWNECIKTNTESLVLSTQQQCSTTNQSIFRSINDVAKTSDSGGDYKNDLPSSSIKQGSDTKTLFNTIINKGIDEEDYNFLKRAFNDFSSDSNHINWISELHWDTHPLTNDNESQYTDYNGNTPVIKTGCARSEGFFRLLPRSKLKDSGKQLDVPNETNNTYGKSYKRHKQSLSRDARNDQRRLFTAYQNITVSDLLKLNDLKFRKKKLRLGKSDIHGLGLFAYEPIPPNEIVIEYVGQIIRPIIADLREKEYKSLGIGSYCFKVDEDTIIDATKYGNLNRYINHSCNPNSYARTLVINNTKKIVIYSKKYINFGEEITYNYKLPFEDDKISCLCNAPGCRKSLN